MNKSKIEERLPEPQHSKEQKADGTSVCPACAKPFVVRSPNTVSTKKMTAREATWLLADMRINGLVGMEKELDYFMLLSQVNTFMASIINYGENKVFSKCKIVELPTTKV